MTLVEYVKRVHRSLEKTLNNADLPFAELVQALEQEGEKQHGTRFPFAFEMYGRWLEQQQRIGDLLVRVEDGRVEESPFGLTLSVSAIAPVFRVELQHQTNMFGEEEVHLLYQNLLTLVGEFASHPHKRLNEVGIF